MSAPPAAAVDARLLFIDCIGGVAGDMLLGALLDAGASLERVRTAVAGLGIGAELEVERTERHGIAAALVTVRAPDGEHHRDWSDVRALVDRAPMPARARRRAHEAFRLLATAEGRVHGIAPEEVRFHEVGAADALVDVCGTALALEDLGVERVACSPLPVGRGFVESAHGTLPLPAPATVELLRGAPLQGVDIDAELVTPTGAALVTALASEFRSAPSMTLEGVGYGAGSRDLPGRPNLVRVLLGTTGTERGLGAKRELRLVECTLDDLPPELVPDAAAACRSAGAADVWVTPVQMKKGRPGVVLTAIVPPEHEEDVAKAMFAETTTLGIRTTAVERWELERTTLEVEVGGQPIGVKLGWSNGSVVNFAPEHDDVVRAATVLARPVKDVWAQAWAVAGERGRGGRASGEGGGE